MNILLTNDDGYNAEGIQILFKKLQKYGDVLLVAPHKHMSGASVSRIFWDHARIHKHGDKIYSVEGTPADAVAFALHALNFNADLVVSGINDGFNIGGDTVYSGTVGACMEALKVHKKAIAFSADYHHFQPAEAEFDKVMEYILKYDLLSENYMLNVNFVSRKYPSSSGIMITDLGFRPVEHYYEQVNKNKFKSYRQFLPYEYVKGTDLYAIHHGFISITPLKYANQSKEALAEIEKKVGLIE